MIPVVYSPEFKFHRPSPEHPEGLWRAEAIVRYLQSGPLRDRIDLIEPEIAPFEILTLVHDPHYLLRFEEACLRGRSYIDGKDNEISFDSYEVARLAAGAVIKAVDLVLEGQKLVFCPVRPPGHHALRERAMGFCFLNNVAIGAKYWQRRRSLRILILDWDAHHGNGIQEAFYEDPSVFYISLHENPRLSFPGTGFAEERGRGPGEGFNLNLPVPLGEGDAFYLETFEKIITPVVESFRPQGIILAAGFDAHQEDDMSFLSLTTEGFGQLSAFLRRWSLSFNAPVISVLEGGYHPEALVTSAESHLLSLVS